MTPPAIVVGGSLSGLATALALAERGCAVRVLERAAPPPEGPAGKAGELWERPTAPQSGHSHILTSLGVRVLRERAPYLLDAAIHEGARLLDLTEAVPPTVKGFVRETADDELVALAMRRPALDLVLQRAVGSRRGVTLSYGTTVRGLLLDRSRSTVSGVVTDRGERIPARIVVDATGRRAESRTWLAVAGVPVADDLTSPTHLRGFTRFYRLTSPGGPPGPLNRGNAAGGIWDHYAAVVHPADNDTFSVTFGVPAADRATSALRRPGPFTAAARISPYLEPWTAAGTAVPITPVRAITMPRNVLRGTIGAPVTGLFPVGDAACVTDPLFGRGMSLGLQHAFHLVDLLDAGPAGERAARLADELYRPWYDQAVRDDGARIGLWRARAEGTTPPPAEPGHLPLASVAAAATTDATVWRGLTRVLMTLARPAEVFDDALFLARVRAAAPAPAGSAPPTRKELLQAIAAAEGA